MEPREQIEEFRNAYMRSLEEDADELLGPRTNK